MSLADIKGFSSYKTTIAGVVAFIGGAIKGYPGAIGIIGQVMEDAGILFVGIFARDNDKASQEVLGK